MSRLCLCAMSLIFTLALSAAAQEIPFKVEKGYLLITGKVKEDLAFEAAVATGNTYSYYNESSLKKLKLSETSSNDIPQTVFTRDNALTLAYVPQLTIADQKPMEMRMMPRHDAFDAMSRSLGRKIDLILGADYFDGRIVQFDFRSHVIRFLDKPRIEYKAGTFALSDGTVRVVSRMTGNIQSMFGTMMTLPVAEDVALNGSKTPSLLNTGIVMPVTARPNVAKKSGTVKDQSGAMTIKVALGEYELNDVPIRLDDVKDEYDRSYSAILGLGVLQNFTITFDWKNKWIVLEK